MLGEMICSTRGKRVVRRVLCTEPLKVEVTFDDGGAIYGVEYKGHGTYCSEVRADGSLFGEGQGICITADGELVTWRGSALGRLLAGGAASYRGFLFFQTASQKLARLNSVCGAMEFEADAEGVTASKVWEWK